MELHLSRKGIIINLLISWVVLIDEEERMSKCCLKPPDLKLLVI